MKKCTKCKCETNLDDFYNDARVKKDGKYAECKTCVQKRSKGWYKKNPTYFKKYAEINKEAIAANAVKRKLLKIKGETI